MKLDEFVWYLYTDTSYFDYVGAMPDGIERQANLRILFQRARQFEETTLKGLFNFVRYIDKLKKTTGDIGAAKILGENENLVRIMSIHKSKGLEFPVVFLCNASKRFNKTDLNRQIILHETLGFGPNFVDLERGITNTTLIKEVIKNKINLESISEEMRVLYVALTRAKEKLIITGQVKDLEKSMKKWTELSSGDELKLSEEKVIKASCYLDWMMAVLLKHRDFSNSRTDGKTFAFGEDVDLLLTVQNKTGILSITESDKNKPSGIFTLDLMKDPAFSFEVNQRLNYAYAFLEDTKRSSKISVTELKRLENLMNVEDLVESTIREEYPMRPEFMMERSGLTAAEKGTAFHKVMQYLDFDRVNLAEIREQLKELTERELIRMEEADSINPFKLRALFETDLGKRMQKADRENRLKREFKFLMHLDDSEVLVIGVIDCFFEEGENQVIVDYKTDYVPQENYQEVLIQRYQEQLRYYKDALQSISGKHTSDIYIYAVQNEKEILLGL
jgi:ATP-dependent helicase/nuclease subunit A